MKSHNVFTKLKVLMMGILVTERGCFGYGKAAIWDATSRLDFYLTAHTKATTKLDYLTTHTKQILDKQSTHTKATSRLDF